MINQEIAKIFYNLAEILEMQEVQWKPRAYKKAALVIENLGESLDEIYKDKGIKGLEEIPGVGEHLAEKIEEYIKRGKIHEYEKLKKTIPKHLLTLLEIPGMGIKKAKFLYEKLKIKNIEQLKKAAKQGKISKLPGFKEKSEENILEGIEFLKETQKQKKERRLLGEILPLAREIKKELEKLKEVEKVDLAGSIRRMKETVHDIDMLAVTKNPKRVMDFFAGLPQVKKVLSKGPKKTIIITKDNLQVDLRVFEKESYGAALQYFTGSKQHSIELRKIAIKKGLKINEYGVFRGKKKVAGKTEEEVYKILGLKYIEPELRESLEEIEASKKNQLPNLIKYNEINGDLHIHTNWSEGNNPIDEMVSEAEKLGYKYIVISDHAGNMKIAHALEEKRLEKQLKEIGKIQKKHKIKILKGAETDILKDGKLSLPDRILEKLDVVIGSVHSGFKMAEKQMTQRVLKAMDNKYLNIIGHPTGRLINERKEYSIDLNKIFEKAAEKGIAMEINAFPNRLDLSDVNIRSALKKGAKLVISTDSHGKEHMRYMGLGIGQARRGWAEAKDIINTYALDKLNGFLKRGR